jgi:hypothetical protein
MTKAAAAKLAARFTKAEAGYPKPIDTDGEHGSLRVEIPLTPELCMSKHALVNVLQHVYVYGVNTLAKWWYDWFEKTAAAAVPEQLRSSIRPALEKQVVEVALWNLPAAAEDGLARCAMFLRITPEHQLRVTARNTCLHITAFVQALKKPLRYEVHRDWLPKKIYEAVDSQEWNFNATIAEVTISTSPSTAEQASNQQQQPTSKAQDGDGTVAAEEVTHELAQPVAVVNAVGEGDEHRQ